MNTVMSPRLLPRIFAVLALLLSMAITPAAVATSEEVPPGDDSSQTVPSTEETPAEATPGNTASAKSAPSKVEHKAPAAQGAESKGVVTVSKSEFVGDEEVVVTVEGSGFDPSLATGVRPPLAGKPAGAYVVFGAFADDWAPSQGHGSNARPVNAGQLWAVSAEDMGKIGGPSAGAVELRADGSFTGELTVSKALLDAKAPDGLDGLNPGIYTYAGSGANVAAYETFTPFTFKTASDPDPTPTTPTPDPKPDKGKAKAGSFLWGVKASWRNYIGNVGTTTLTNGASRSGSQYRFGQLSTTATPPSAVGKTNYRGTMRFVAHGGELDLSLANPAVRVTDGNVATVSFQVGKKRVDVLGLNLSSAKKSTAGGAVTYSGAPARLLPSGVSVFNGFYSSGEVMDSVTFTVGSKAAVTNAVYAAGPTKAQKWEAPATPPATTGLEVSETKLEQGATITATANGFMPNETGIKVVIYSEPRILSENVTADANGRATWTGKLPTLPEGDHTLTFQGSKSFGAVLTLEPEAEIEGCKVTDASLDWGFKEAFRAYITSNIAKGDWRTKGDVTYATPQFTWEPGSGVIGNDEGRVDFKGTVFFDGHDGALDATVIDPKVVFTGNNTAALVIDYAGSDMDDAMAGKGVKKTTKDVAFVNLKLEDANRTVDGNTVTLADVPTAFTDQGSAVFPMYEPGEAFDPVTLTYTLEDGCDPGAVATQASGQSDDVASASETTADDGAPFWLRYGLPLLVLLVIAGIAAAMIARRERPTS